MCARPRGGNYVYSDANVTEMRYRPEWIDFAFANALSFAQRRGRSGSPSVTYFSFSVMRPPVEQTITISQALPRETESVSSILLEAAHWLRERGIPMWRGDELSPERIATDVAEGYFSWPSAAVKQSAQSSFSCRTLFSGPILPRTRLPLFIAWPCAARLRADSSPPCF